ncbi:hypothetical protein AB4225_36205 [Streptomyces sp. 2RAF24]|uniref:hypothetical protein n=1 Tax=Streptomyces sp. 2RAF24 TaxID=3232997 RepID=UPI003F980AEB
MTEPMTQLTAPVLRQLLRMAQNAANPMTVVKHGQREDRAASYDRFVQACTRAVRYRDLDDGMGEVWAALQAIHLRSGKEIRAAADMLHQRVAAIADGGTIGEFARWADDATWDASEDRPDLEREFGRDISREDETVFTRDLSAFVEEARLDLLCRWWHRPLPRTIRRWYLRRR